MGKEEVTTMNPFCFIHCLCNLSYNILHQKPNMMQNKMSRVLSV